MLAVMAVIASLTSCMENNNDWVVDPTANENRTWAPLELSVNKGDTYLNIYGFKATNATSYVAQVSKVNFEGASEDEIISYKFTKEDMFPAEHPDTMTLGFLEPKTSYYVRVKAQAEGKEDSQWVEYVNKKTGEKTVKTEAPQAASYSVSFGSEPPTELAKYWHDFGMTIYPKGTNFEFDVNKKKFDDEEYPVRMKSKNGSELRLSVAGKGVLSLMVLSANSTLRKVVVTPVDGTPGKAQTIEVDNQPSTKDMNLEKGKYSITWPDGQVNFYAFKYVLDDDEEPVEDEIEKEPEPGPGPDLGFEGTFSFVGLTLDDITTNGTTSEESGYIGISSSAGVEMTTNLKSQENIVLSYTNSGAKTGIVRLYPDFVSINGKGALIKINNLKVGQTVKVQFASKNSTATNLTANSGCTLQGTASSTGTTDIVEATFVATASSISIKENVVGFNLYSIKVIK